MKSSHVFETGSKALLLVGSEEFVLEGSHAGIEALESEESFRFLICNFHIVNIIMSVLPNNPKSNISKILTLKKTYAFSLAALYKSAGCSVAC